MLKLVPNVKHLELKGDFIKMKAISAHTGGLDARLDRAIEKIPHSENGLFLNVDITGDTGEGYEISITDEAIYLTADSPRGAFCGIQTLRQIFNHTNVPTLYIKDFPDFEYRGFYQDVTRGKIPKVETLKRFIDLLALTKHNAFQIYIEHVYEFEQYSEIHDKTGFYTAEEIRELDDYCYENFIEFEPSLSCFGHLYELLELERYKHLRCHKEELSHINRWSERGGHHTIDPRNPESLELIISMIDEYAQLFRSRRFNICCDETFDLKMLEKEGCDYVTLYVDFVSKLARHLRESGREVMMWGDVAREHPEALRMLPDGITFINWTYNQGEVEESFKRFDGLHHIVAPCACSQGRFIEAHHFFVPIIKLHGAWGKKYGAYGMLNTNWGDWGNPASLEMAYCGAAFGGAVAWDIDSEDDECFRSAVNLHIHKYSMAYQLCLRMNEMHTPILWHDFVKGAIAKYRNDTEYDHGIVSEYDVGRAQREYKILNGIIPLNDLPLSREMRITAEGICVMFEYLGIFAGYNVKRITDTKQWLERYSALWREKNKESELYKIIELFTWLINNVG